MRKSLAVSDLERKLRSLAVVPESPMGPRARRSVDVKLR
jgi:hypothetical protein